MCLALVALDAHPKYRCVIVANRDEFHARAAEPARWWDEGFLAGRDLVAGGSWFGVTRSGRWALITNFREGIPRDPYAPSRGELVMRMLREAASPLRSSAALLPDGGRYHGFNLLVGDDIEVAFASNRASGALSLGAARSAWPHGSPTTTRRSRPDSRSLPIASPQAMPVCLRPAFRRSGKACSRRRSSSARSTERGRRPSC